MAADSHNTSTRRSRALKPNTPSSASACCRLATDSDKIENTKNAPVNNATSASTVRLTR